MAKASPTRSSKTGNGNTGSPTNVRPNIKSAKPPVSTAVGEETIRQRAYEIYVQEGRLDGRDQEHWFRAEAEVRGDTQRSA